MRESDRERERERERVRERERARESIFFLDVIALRAAPSNSLSANSAEFGSEPRFVALFVYI